VWFTRSCTKLIVWTSLLFCPLLMLAAAAAMPLLLHVKQDALIASGVLAIAALLQLFCVFCCWRRLIPFTVEVLRCVASVLVQHPSLVIVSLMGFVASLAWTVLAAVAFMGIFDKMQHDSETHCRGNRSSCHSTDNDKAMFYGLYFLVTLIFVWGSTVFLNVCHVTNCGVFGRWYFGKHASVRRSMGVALTTSFGSICLGSLIVAVIQAIESVLNQMRRQAQREGANIAVVAILCALECIVTCIKDIVEAFTYFAYVQVAVRGLSFMQSARATWGLCTWRNVPSIIATCLVGSVVSFGALMCGVASGLLGFFAAKACQPTHISKETLEFTDTANLIIGMVLGLIVASTALNTLRSGFATIVVCWAEHNEALCSLQPELHNSFSQRAGLGAGAGLGPV